MWRQLPFPKDVPLKTSICHRFFMVFHRFSIATFEYQRVDVVTIDKNVNHLISLISLLYYRWDRIYRYTFQWGRRQHSGVTIFLHLPTGAHIQAWAPLGSRYITKPPWPNLRTLKVKWDHLPSVGMTKNLAVQPHAPSVCGPSVLTVDWKTLTCRDREFLSSGTVPKWLRYQHPRRIWPQVVTGCALRHPLRRYACFTDCFSCQSRP